MEEFFRAGYERGWFEKIYTSLQEFVNEKFGSEEEFTFYLISDDAPIYFEYINKYPYLQGILINPDGSEVEFSTANLETNSTENLVYYIINQNGDYTFEFINYDGRTGKITVRINEDTPQIIGLTSIYDGIFAVMAGVDNFLEIEKGNMKLWTIKNEIINEKEVDLTEYIKISDGYGSWNFPKGCQYINLSSDDLNIYQNNAYAQITITAGGKEIKRNSKINNYPS